MPDFDVTGTTRDHAVVTRLFGGCELVEPGVVPGPKWRPDSGVARRS